MYADPAAPTCDAQSSSPLPFSLSRPPMAPTMVTARPSRIQTVPRPAMIIQCQRDHGRRSIRAGMFVSMVLYCGAPAAAPAAVVAMGSSRRAGTTKPQAPYPSCCPALAVRAPIGPVPSAGGLGAVTLAPSGTSGRGRAAQATGPAPVLRRLVLDRAQQRPGDHQPAHDEHRQARPEVDVDAGGLRLDLVGAQDPGQRQDHAVDQEHRADDAADVEAVGRARSLGLVLDAVVVVAGRPAEGHLLVVG